MQSQDIHITDIMRILIGEVQPGFYIELFIRALAVYLILIVAMRIMGKRMSSQLSRNELAALVSLAAAIGIPMMAPDRGVLSAIVIAFVLITTERLIAKYAFKNQKFESYSQGNVSALITNGVLDMKEMKRVSLSLEGVFAQLRSQGLLQLGTVSRFYMEASGTFTLVRNTTPVPGLSVLPEWDEPLKDYFVEHHEHPVCAKCGLPKNSSGQANKKCPNCGNERWVASVQEVSNS